jgi:tetratricopeptide (TPR) repeat protein
MNDPTRTAVPATADYEAPSTADPETHPNGAGPFGEAPGAVIGPFCLVRALGQGGMGAVWLAEQTHPVRRQVALKVIKAGMDTAAVIARFEAERQALALMDHPNIAKVLDAGTTPAGRPFFAMELVEGTPINRYCDQQRLTVRQRLGLFIPVCRAVQHAHQKGIIHRDLKPSNVLVTSYDGQPVPKVIDFGIAKATGPQLAGGDLLTEAGALVGTPEYMAPEQADPGNADIDTRADIYALGVILYELLAGSLPFSRTQGGGVSLFGLLEMICQAEPPRPSTRLAAAESLTDVAAARRAEPGQLPKLIRGELDWVVMKCLEKNRARRYETANGLAADIQRFLDDEPVAARPASVGFRLRKFVRRNRPAVAAAALVALALAGGIVGTTYGLVQANRAKQSALRRLEQIEKNNEILGAVFTDLDPRRAEKDGDPLSTILGRRLADAAGQLEGDAVGDRLTVARMQNTLGVSLIHLGHAGAAIPVLQKSAATRADQLGEDHPDTLMSRYNLAYAHLTDGQGDEAVSQFQAVLAGRTAVLGDNHTDTIAAMNALAVAYRQGGRRDSALPILERAVRSLDAHPDADHLTIAAIRANLADEFLNAGRYQEAIPLFERAVQSTEARLGPNHIETLSRRESLANALRFVGQPARAVPELERVASASKALLGANHPATLSRVNTLAKAYNDVGQLAKALAMFEANLKAREERLGFDHPDTVTSRDNLARAYKSAGRFDEALALFEASANALVSKLGADHPSALTARNNLAVAYTDAGQSARAVPLLEAVLAATEAKLGLDHADALSTRTALANAYLATGLTGKAITLLEATLRGREAQLGADHPSTSISRGSLGRAYRQAGRLADAIACFEQSFRDFARKLAVDHVHTTTTAVFLAECYLEVQHWADAEAVCRQVLAERDRKTTDDHAACKLRYLLATSLLGQGRFAEAERLLRQCHSALTRNAVRMPAASAARLKADTLSRLVEASERLGQPDAAAGWKKELETVRP